MWLGGTFVWDITVVPAPGSFALLGLGALVARRR
ncbi:MAG: PEP-CTERM sorting domain-containing protein [Phycisphaerales bacterium JB038]